MESRCSLIRVNVTDKTWVSRYMSLPPSSSCCYRAALSQLPHRARPRRPAPTIIKTELSLIKSGRFCLECFTVFVHVFLYEWAAILKLHSVLFCLFFCYSIFSSHLYESGAKDGPTVISEIMHFPSSLISAQKKKPIYFYLLNRNAQLHCITGFVELN